MALYNKLTGESLSKEASEQMEDPTSVAGKESTSGTSELTQAQLLTLRRQVGQETKEQLLRVTLSDLTQKLSDYKSFTESFSGKIEALAEMSAKNAKEASEMIRSQMKEQSELINRTLESNRQLTETMCALNRETREKVGDAVKAEAAALAVNFDDYCRTILKQRTDDAEAAAHQAAAMVNEAVRELNAANAARRRERREICFMCICTVINTLLLIAAALMYFCK